VARLIEFEDPEQVSAFLGEPIQQGFGAYAPPSEYWPIIREICDRYGVLLIIDEVICGFGRTGKWFGVEHFGIAPDLMTMAKGISSGYVPLGAAGCTAKVLEPIDTLQHLHTYGNHPVACAAGLKSLEILERERLVENAREVGAYFLGRLREMERYAIVGEARGIGLWTALDLTLDKATRASFPMSRMNGLVKRGKDKGLILKFMGPSLEFAPPLTVARGEIDEGMVILDQCLAEETRELGLG
jgi:putrescine aminotransferase